MSQTKPRFVACLGWGSLVWDPQELPIRGEWFQDGPLLPIELARKSDTSKRPEGGRATFVLLEKAALVRTMWALMAESDVDAARESLRKREGPTKSEYIGYWCKAEHSNKLGVEAISRWARSIGVDGVVWTDLPPSEDWKVKSLGELGDAVLQHIRSLPYEWGKLAEEYVRRAPRQTDTEVRRRLERELGWSPM